MSIVFHKQIIGSVSSYINAFRYFCIAANWVNEKIDEEKFDAMVKELPVSNEQFELHKQFKNGVKTALEVSIDLKDNYFSILTRLFCRCY